MVARKSIYKLSRMLRFQNLDQRPGDRMLEASGSIFKHGRLFFQPFGSENPGVRIEWAIPSKFCHAEFEVDLSENEVSVGLAIPPVAVWVHVTDLWKYMKGIEPWESFGWKEYTKEVKVAFYEGILMWNIWYDPHQTTTEMPRWRHGSFFPMDYFFGEQEQKLEVVRGPIDVLIPMPERAYKAVATLSRLTLKRKRLPWNSDQFLKIDIENEGDPVPVPGKGTADYNQDETAYSRHSGPASSIVDGISHMVRGVLEKRDRYASLDWVPEKDHTPQ